MFNSTRRKRVEQIGKRRLHFSPGGGLPLGDVLESNFLVEILKKASKAFRDRIFPPIVTLAAFLSQVLSEDHSCREAFDTAIF